MSDNLYGTEPTHPTDPTNPTGPVPAFSERTSADTVDAAADDVVSARARAQRRLAQARISAWDATARARVAAAARRTATPTGDTDDTLKTTLSDRAQAYRVHILSVAGAAAVALLVAVLRRRRAARRRGNATIDLGKWQLHAEPTETSNYEVG